MLKLWIEREREEGRLGWRNKSLQHLQQKKIVMESLEFVIILFCVENLQLPSPCPFVVGRTDAISVVKILVSCTIVCYSLFPS